MWEGRVEGQSRSHRGRGKECAEKWPQGSRGQLVRLHTVLPNTQTHTQGLKMELSSKLHCPAGTSSFESGKDTLWVGFALDASPLFQPGLSSRTHSAHSAPNLSSPGEAQKPWPLSKLHPSVSCCLSSLTWFPCPRGVSQNPFPRTRFRCCLRALAHAIPCPPSTQALSILLSSRFSPRSPPPGSSF